MSHRLDFIKDNLFGIANFNDFEERYAIGIRYAMEIELSPLVVKDQEGKASINEKVFQDDIAISYTDAGEFYTQIQNRRYPDKVEDYYIRSDFGKRLGDSNSGVDSIDGDAYTETGRRHVTARGRTEDVRVRIINDSNLEAKINAISQRGTIVNR